MKRPLLLLLSTAIFTTSAFAQNEQDQQKPDRYYYQAQKLTKFYEYDIATGQLVNGGAPKRTFSRLRFDAFTNNPERIGGSDYYLVDLYDIKDETYHTKGWPARWFQKKANRIETVKLPGGGALKGNATYINSNDNNKVFAIEAGEFSKYLENNVIEIIHRPFSRSQFIYGASFTAPFKFRPAVQDKNYIFSPEIQLGGYCGYKIRLSRTEPHYLNFPIVSAGFNSIILNDNTTYNTSNTNRDGLAMGFTGSAGVVFQLNDYQIGLVAGTDLLGGDLGKSWLYNQKVWYSLGIGFSFLGGTKAEEKRDAVADLKAKEKASANQVNAKTKHTLVPLN